MINKKTVKEESVKKYGFFFSLVIMVGSVVGISIFFKNYQVFNAVEGDSTLIVSAWIIGAIVSLMTALSFIDISTLASKSKMPFRKWSAMFVSKKYSDFVGIVALMYAYALVLPTLYYYCYSFMVQAFGGAPTLVGAIIAMIIIPLGLFTLNIFAEKGSALFSKITTGLKILPLVVVAFAGLFFTSNGGGFSTTETLFNTARPSSNLLLFALPPILFSFDGFLTITNISHKTKKPRKNIPLSIILGMSLIAGLYILITISQINHFAPTIQASLNNIFSNKYLTKITLFFIAIAAFSVSNIITMSAKITCQSLIDDDIIPFSDFYKKKFRKGSDNAGGFIMMVVTIVTALILMLIQSVLVSGGFIDDLKKVRSNNEARTSSLMIDEFSNYPTYFFYPIYCSVILGNVIALLRKKLPNCASPVHQVAFKDLLNKTSKRRKNLIIGLSIIASLMIILIISVHIFYNILYVRIIKPIENGDKLTPDAKLDILMFLINLWLFQFIPLVCLFSRNKGNLGRI